MPATRSNAPAIHGSGVSPFKLMAHVESPVVVKRAAAFAVAQRRRDAVPPPTSMLLAVVHQVVILAALGGREDGGARFWHTADVGAVAGRRHGV